MQVGDSGVFLSIIRLLQLTVLAGPSRGRPAGNTFGGGGVRLGDAANPGQATAAETFSGSAGRNASQVAVENNAPVALRMWRNGFTVDDGPLRRYDDPANAEFMNSVKQGRVPLELITAARGKELRVQMEDKRDQEYTEPKRPKEFFTGTGHMLGRLVLQFEMADGKLTRQDRFPEWCTYQCFQLETCISSNNKT